MVKLSKLVLEKALELFRELGSAEEAAEYLDDPISEIQEVFPEEKSSDLRELLIVQLEELYDR